MHCKKLNYYDNNCMTNESIKLYLRSLEEKLKIMHSNENKSKFENLNEKKFYTKNYTINLSNQQQNLNQISNIYDNSNEINQSELLKINDNKESIFCNKCERLIPYKNKNLHLLICSSNKNFELFSTENNTENGKIFKINTKIKKLIYLLNLSLNEIEIFQLEKFVQIKILIKKCFENFLSIEEFEKLSNLLNDSKKITDYLEFNSLEFSDVKIVLSFLYSIQNLAQDKLDLKRNSLKKRNGLN